MGKRRKATREDVVRFIKQGGRLIYFNSEFPVDVVSQNAIWFQYDFSKYPKLKYDYYVDKVKRGEV